MFDDVPNIGNLQLNWESMNSKKKNQTYQEYLSGNCVSPKLNSKIICNVAREKKVRKQNMSSTKNI